MRILQLIDSLRPGGAEQMAVAYANAFGRRVEGSHLCCTRMEGSLKSKISPDVGYLFLKKKNTLDLWAFWKLRKYIKKHNINLIQAHSSSYFLAGLMKLSVPGIKLVWHDHYGKDLKERKSGTLKVFSKYFDGIISVNPDLKNWAKKNLYGKKIRYFKNFIADIATDIQRDVSLKRENSLKIICVANFRPQKDHYTLLKAFRILSENNEGISLHLIGKDESDLYSQGIKKFIQDNNLEKNVFVYGAQPDVGAFLDQADMGVLSSVSEGLPVSLLEYGRAGLPVVCTRVGECPEVIGPFGFLVPPGDPEALAAAIEQYVKDSERREKDAQDFQNKISEEYSEEAVMPEVLDFFEKVLHPIPPLK